jgi:hypothetical protein
MIFVSAAGNLKSTANALRVADNRPHSPNNLRVRAAIM